MYPTSDKDRDGTPLTRDANGNLLRPSGEVVGRENIIFSNTITHPTTGEKIGERGWGGIVWDDKREK